MNAKTFFLTYPRSIFTKDEFLSFAQSKGTLVEYVVGSELHADGTPHIHAALKYQEPIRGAFRLFDFKERHPNIQSPKRFAACKQYCKKDGDFIENDPEAQQELQTATSPNEICKTFAEEVEWYNYCATNKIAFQYAKYFWDANHLDIVTIQDGDTIVGTICESLKSYRWDSDKYPTLSIVGRAGCGKTTWAKCSAPKPTLFVSHIDQLKLFKPGYHKVIIICYYLYKSIIFDDMDIRHWPRQSQIHLLDSENPRAIHLRHHVATIPSGTVKIFTSNDDIVDLTDPAIRRRIYKITVRENGIIGQ